MAQHPFPDRRFGAFLFDMDGTILNSIVAAERVWGAWARRQGIDVDSFLPTIHGMRAIETMRRVGIPEAVLEAEIAGLVQAEIDDVEGIVEIAGAAIFLKSLPPERWTIVTSAPRALAEKRLAIAGLPVPPLMVTGEDVANGKPAPDCFLLGARKLGVPIEECLVFEDAPAGIRAGEAAGATVLVIDATHSHRLDTPHPSVSGYDALAVSQASDGTLEIIAKG
ncbi:HAD family hydrolase [Aureimonas phyllosphaerae]|uniref:Sugar-phosphatase n=1 Tax=Aureimonas phyllosphaerae TaxID=1166078 RepID=A0A7W6BUB6_9HYPH|nr:HAD family hydrolase [Aureimonas phyllosphaerae]MBB3936189.1 sugar-phosphatase [Aureimonas phyllosphaerae]MBB3960086.1 sugar-phosphatase [Aureimonas phyllosphaerae]SFF33114.1 sugar-phosphatase [Aureimonas phyllosphaerae]